MSNHIDFMVDLETLGNTPTAVIVQIGALAFDRVTGHILYELSINVEIKSELDNGFTVDGSTIEWWMQQAKEGKCTWTNATMHSFSAINELLHFFDRHMTDSSLVWSHSTFDAPILANHFAKYDQHCPIHWSKWVDLRTISLMATGVTRVPKEVRPEDAHDALADCKYQLEWLQECRAKLLHKKE